MVIQNGLKTYRKISHPTKRLIGKKNYKKEKKKNLYIFKIFIWNVSRNVNSHMNFFITK